MRNSLIFCFLLFASSLFAQTNFVKGVIVDSSANPVPGVVVIVQTTDSVYVNAGTTDTSGAFEIEANVTEFRLIFQHFVFIVKTIESTNYDVGTIVLEDKISEIDEVVIKGERPLVRVVNGVLTYDIERITEGKVVSNAYESILHLPGVREDNGSLTLAGANSVTVIINGTPTTMSPSQLITILKSMPASRIESAEVMYSAPPQYHVRGAAINLIIKNEKPEIPVLQGEVNGSYIQRHYGSYSAGLSLLHNSKKISSDFMYGMTNLRERSGLDLLSYHTLNNAVYQLEQHNSGFSDALVHNARLGFDYNINENNRLSLVYTTQITPLGKGVEYSVGDFSESHNERNGDNVLHNIGLDYTSGFGLKTGANYTFYRSSSEQDFHNIYSSGNPTDFISKSQQKINRVMFYADQNHALAKQWNLNYGASFAYAKDHDYQKYTLMNAPNISLSDTDGKIDEYTANIYAGFSKSFSEKLSMRLSLSGEYYKLADFDNWSLYPVSEITYMPSYTHIFQFSLSSDKTFPSYWEVQESIGYLNGYAEIHGNPNLKPSKNYTSQLSYILKTKYIVTAYFSYAPDYFQQLPYQSPDRIALIYQTRNWNFMQSAGLNVIVPFKLKEIVDSRLTINGFNSRVKSDDFFDTPFDRSKWIFYSRLDNTIKISSKPDIKMEIMGFYLTPSMQGIYDLSAVWSVDAGVKWTFAGEKAELRVKGTDIFNSMMPDLDINYKNQRLDSNVFSDSRTFTFSFLYKFGGYKQKEWKEVDTSRFR